jgi:hypothetical protein
MQQKSAIRSLLLQIRSSLYWAVPALIGGLWLLLALDASEYVVPAAALAAVAGFIWQMRARARRRWAALDAYAEREIARAHANTVQRRAKRHLATAGTLNHP